MPDRCATILNDSRAPGCEAACGIDWTDLEMLYLVTSRVKEKFGDSVQIYFIDLAECEDDENFRHWADEARQKNLSFPLLLFNGRLKISGNFDIRQLLDIIEVETEIRCNVG